MASVCQERVTATNLKAFRIDFTNACANWEHSLHIGTPQCSDTIEEATKTFGMFKHIQVVTGLYGRTSEQHANIKHTHSFMR